MAVPDMLVDEAKIYVRGGQGGDGSVSFRREKYVPRGGPDGGDGGHGGDVIAVATPGVDTLLDFSGRHHWIAKNGQPGRGKNCTGRSGTDLILRLPAGTLIYDLETGILIKDLSTPGERVCLAEGGAGGRGNARFARPDHQTPREFEKGSAGQERWLRLELKLIADVGIVGLPNAGKSTLLARISKARPRIADYPFTTLHPHLGIVELSGFRRMVVADTPGLIEGAHAGVGLGDAFLKHIERTRLILHLVDVGPDSAAVPPPQAYETVRRELAEYSPALAEKPEVIAASKIDLTGAEEAAREFAERIGCDVFPISAVTGRGLEALLEEAWNQLEALRNTALAQDAPPAAMESRQS